MNIANIELLSNKIQTASKAHTLSIIKRIAPLILLRPSFITRQDKAVNS